MIGYVNVAIMGEATVERSTFGLPAWIKLRSCEPPFQSVISRSSLHPRRPLRGYYSNVMMIDRHVPTVAFRRDCLQLGEEFAPSLAGRFDDGVVAFEDAV